MITRLRRSRRLPALALATCVLATGCGSDDDGAASAAPIPDATDIGGNGGENGGDADATLAPADDASIGGDLEQRATGIVRDVLDVVDGVAAESVPMPDVVVETTPSLIYYQSDIDGTSVVVVPDWEDLREERALFDEWAGATAGAYDGRALFEELFNWFFVAHETGHLLQTVSGIGPETRQGEERQANDIAVAHFAATEPARLEALVSALADVRDALPVPERADDPEYFETEYDAIGSIPPVYGWFQFGFVLDSYARVNELDLATIARDDLGL